MTISMLVRFLVVLVIFVPLVDTGNPQPNGQALPGTFLETFDGAPASPQAFNSPNWDVAVHSRDVNTWQQLEPMEAQHDMNCGAPPATHHQHGDYADAVFLCRDHVMTAINASGYGVLYLTPNRLLDFSQGEAVIRFDMSTLRTSTRDWVDIWITPYGDNLQLPFETGDVDLQGVPRNAVHLRMDNANGNGTMFRPTIYRDFQATSDFEPFSDDYNWYTGYESVLQPSPSRRDVFEIRLSRTHLKMGMPAYNLWWVDKDIQALGWTSGVVQLGHHSYTPTKDCGGKCSANTWHWDNVSLSPAVPFTQIKADRRFVIGASERVSFAQPAPANTHLRFSAIGDVDISFDSGASWQAARKQPSSRLSTGYHPEHLSNYWMSVPQGTRTAQFRFGSDSWYQGPYIAKDFAYWSLSGSGSNPPGPQATPTSPPAATATAQPTQAPVRTPTPQPTATATAAPATGSAINVYDDALEASWQDWSWDPITRNFNNTSPVHDGAKSIAVTYTGGWSALMLGRGTALKLAGNDVLRFWIRGSTSQHPIEVRVGNQDEFVRQVITPSANTWTEVKVPIDQLASDGVSYVWWQNLTPTSQSVVHLDDIAFVDE